MFLPDQSGSFDTATTKHYNAKAMSKKEQKNTPDADLEIVADNHQSEPELESIEQAEGQKIKSLKKKLKAVETEKKQLLEDLQRAKADFLNTKKRLEEERERDRNKSAEGHIRDLLPLCDSFELAKQDKEAWEKIDASWRQGMDAIHSQLKSILEANQVEPIEPIGQPFDPARHEAVEVRADEKVATDTVLAVVQTGYIIGDSVIRPAKVTISSGPADN